jgi:ABC-type phosphate transport system permease subunit
MWLVKFLYWLHLFVVPVLVLGLVGLIAGNEMVFAVLTALGIIIAIFLAEYVRRKIGLIRFLADSLMI